MTNPKKNSETPTAPVRPYDETETTSPEPVEIEAPRSTEAQGKEVPLPDLGGKID